MIVVTESPTRAIELDVFDVFVVHQYLDEYSKLAPVSKAKQANTVFQHLAYTMLESGGISATAIMGTIEYLQTQYREVTIGHYFPMAVDAALFGESSLRDIFKDMQTSVRHYIIAGANNDI